MSYRIVLATLLILGWEGIATAQIPDSIDAQQAVMLAIASHPLVARAGERVHAAESMVDLARVPNSPTITGMVDYSHLGPVSSITLPEQGEFKLFPANDYDLHLGLSQTVYDFGRTGAAVRHAQTGVELANDSLTLVKRDLAYQTMGVFYRILILRENVNVLDEEIAALNQHLDVSQKRVETGSATKLDVLNTEVRLATARDERIDAAKAVEQVEITFRSLVGLPPDQPVRLSGTLDSQSITVSDDSLLAVAEQQRPEIQLLESAQRSAELQERMAALSDKPSVGVNLLGGFKNGYIPNLNRLMGNYVAGITLNVPVFDGNRSRRERQVATAGINIIRATRADVRLRIAEDVRQAATNVRASQEKIDNAEVQVARADEALATAKVQYDAGVITNLDLLDAQTAQARARQAYLQALYDSIMSLNALDRATGKRIW